jgi:hypothetical protein
MPRPRYTQQPNRQLSPDDKGIRRVVHPVAGDCPPHQLIAGDGSVHGQNVLNERKVGSIIKDVIDASEQRKNADSESKHRLRYTSDHAQDPLKASPTYITA